MALKIVLDSVLDAQPMPAPLAWIVGDLREPLALLNVAVVAAVLIALLQAASAYLNAYYTVSIGQWIAHDLRQSIYAHLQRLSMSYYDRQQVGPLISTITDDVNAVQDFVSTSLLDILIDSLTIVGMLAVMFALNWSFMLIAIAVIYADVSIRQFLIDSPRRGADHRSRGGCSSKGHRAQEAATHDRVRGHE